MNNVQINNEGLIRTQFSSYVAADNGKALFEIYCSKKLAHTEYEELIDALIDKHLDELVFSSDPFIRAIAESRTRSSLGKVLISNLTDTLGENMNGVELSKQDGSQSLVLSPDASEPGRFRATYFDSKGFFGHVTRDSYLELLHEVVPEGYTKQVKGALRAAFNSGQFLSPQTLSGYLSQKPTTPKNIQTNNAVRL